MYVEVNLDAIVGPTHHFGGVGVGNVASAEHQRQPSSPRRGALEGLRKARLVASLGVPQFVLPPLTRPLPDFLSRLGFEGPLAAQCQAARASAPHAYSAAFSSAFMWAANAGTFAPQCDCRDGRHHLTLANLSSSWHRASEHADRQAQFGQMFSSLPSTAYAIHQALPPVLPLRDEGAANHMRLCDATGSQALHLFVHGDAGLPVDPSKTSRRFIARQTLDACAAVARLHGLAPERTFFLQQHPLAIDAGVFHNDVISTSHRHVLLMHQQAFLDAEKQLDQIAQSFQSLTGQKLNLIEVPANEVTLQEAVSSYLFNSQLVTPADDQEAMILICADQCRQTASVKRWIERLIADNSNPVAGVHYVSLNESMSGGGGPACLRLRLQLPQEQVEQFAPQYRLTTELADRLEAWIESCYPEQLTWESLASPENLELYARAYQLAGFDQLNSTRLPGGK